jgi:regulator of protease activity HflC (stomatin/prohibitin superfamily)
MSISSNVNMLFSKNKFTKKGSGIQLILAIIILIAAVWTEMITNIEMVLYVLLAVSAILMISSFLILINQYERAIILRLGKYKKQVKPGIHTRIPLADNVLVIDVR